MTPERDGIEIIEPSKYMREIQLLPGTEERKLKLVDSLNELKAQMDKANREASAKQRRLNNLIIAGSLVALVFMIYPNSRSNNKDEKSKAVKIFKFFGWALSIGAFIKGFNGRANSITVIEPKPKDENYSFDSHYSSFDKKSATDKLRLLLVKAFIDVLLKFEFISRLELKAKLTNLKYKNTSEANKKLINAMIDYDRSR